MKGGRDILYSQQYLNLKQYPELVDKKPEIEIKPQIEGTEKTEIKPEETEGTEIKPEETEGTEIKPEETEEEYNIKSFIELYPKYLTFNGNNNFFVTPLVLNKYDLMLLYLQKEQFYSLFEKLKDVNNFIDPNITSDNLYEEYSSFIINSGENNNNNNLFVLNLALLLQSNCYESFFQKVLIYYNKNQTQPQKGGVNTFREKLLATGGVELIENSFNITSIVITLTAINTLLGNPISKSFILILSIIILSFGTKKSISLLGKVIDRGIGMLPPSIRNNRAVRLLSSANVDTVQNYFNNFNCRISRNISNVLRQQYARYTANVYNNDMKINSLPYEQLKQEFIEFQQSNGYLTDDFTNEQIINEPIPPPNIENDELRNFVQFEQNEEGRTIANLTPEGIAFFNNLSQPDRNSLKQRLQNLFQNQQQKAAIIRINLNTILNPAPEQQVNVRREFKHINCPLCNMAFSFNPTDGYIHQVQPTEEDINEHINILRQADPNLIDNAQLRETTERELQFNNKLNLFPCKQLIQSLTPEKKLEPGYTFNSQFGENAENGEEYGANLMCSFCCLRFLKTIENYHYTLYIGPRNKNVFIPHDLALELIANLTPTELFQQFNFQFNKNVMVHFKIYQNRSSKLLIEKLITKLGLPNDEESIEASRTNVIQNHLNIVYCPTCSDTTTGRFYKAYDKNDIETLYLRCIACSTSFNGCDRNPPYLLNIQQFKMLANSCQMPNFDLCKFINVNINPRAQRENMLCRVNIETYKKIKRAIIIGRARELNIKRMEENSTTKCPHCNILGVSDGKCSVMTCNNCETHFCYLCGERAGHNNNHFILGTNVQSPLGGYYTIQCINVNFTGIDPDGRQGIHFNVRINDAVKGANQNWFPSANPQNPNVGWMIRPNPDFQQRSRVIWKKYNYLVEKYRRLGQDANVVLRNSGPLTKIEDVYYDNTRDECYESGGLIDPEILVQNDIREMEARIDVADPNKFIVTLGELGEDNNNEILEYVEPVEGPQVAGPQVAGPQVAGPQVARPPVAGPPVAGPQVARPPVAGPLMDFIDEDLFMNDEQFNAFLAQQQQQQVQPEAGPVAELVEGVDVQEFDLQQLLLAQIENQIGQNLQMNGAIENVPQQQQEEPQQEDENNDLIQALMAADIAEQEENNPNFNNNVAVARLINAMPNQPPNIRLPIQEQGQIFDQFNGLLNRERYIIQRQREQRQREQQRQQQRELEEQQAQQVLHMIQLQQRMAEEQNQQRYIELLHMVDNFIRQREEENNEFLDLYRHGREIIVQQQQQNVQLIYQANDVLLEMINEMVVLGITRRYTNYSITHICFFNFLGSYSLIFRKNTGEYFNQRGQQMAFNDDIVRNMRRIKCIELNFDILKRLTNNFNQNAFGRLYQLDLNNILLDQPSIEYIYNNFEALINQNAGKNSKTRKNKIHINKNKITRKKLNRKNKKKSVKRKNHKKKIKTHKK